jgi:YD repeat-containing protein
VAVPPSLVRRWLGAGVSTAMLLSLAAAAADRAGPAIMPPGVLYTYDELGRLTAVTDPDAGAAVYRYDPAGNIVSVERLPAGQLPSGDATPDQPPVVDEFSPTIVHPGEVVTISGERFTGDPIVDQVVIGESTYAAVESASPSELVARVPRAASSGRLSVATPNGTGHGASDLFVIPWEEYTASDVAATARVVPGEPTPVAFDASGRVTLVAFDGRRDQRVTLDVAGELDCFDLPVGWAGPSGEILAAPDGGGWCGRDVPVELPADGTYTLLITARPGTTGAATLTLTDVTAAGPPATPAPAEASSEVVRVAAADRIVDGAAVAPVDLGNGALLVEHTDLVVDDGLPLTVTRSYRPRTDPAALVDRGPFGIGSELPYALQLRTSPALQYADLLLPEGTALPFERTTDGTDAESAVFVPVGARNPASGGQITYHITDGNRGFELRLEDGTTLVFAGNTLAIPLVAVRDRYGNALTIERERDSIGRAGSIVAIHGPSGRSVRFTYDDQNRIVEARDHTGRTVSYRYTSDGLLAAAVSSTGTGIGYTYDDQQRVTAVADTSSERPLVTVTYDDNGLVSEQASPTGRSTSSPTRSRPAPSRSMAPMANPASSTCGGSPPPR